MLFSKPQTFAHGDRIQLDGAPIRLRVDARARRVSLRVDAKKREVVATAPTQRRLTDAVAFARSRAVWIAGQLAILPPPSAIAPGVTLEVLGAPCRLEAATGRARLHTATDTAPMRITAPDGERFAPSVVRLLKTEARRVLAERTAVHAAALGQPLPTVSIMDARGRWGSCTPARKGGFGAAARVGSIRYSWRLVLAPWDVMDYVAAHEVAHLVEANHGEGFWRVVEGLIGDHRPYRKWLRGHGTKLHGVG
jgi:predicted metal-dependent hydrolase